MTRALSVAIRSLRTSPAVTVPALIVLTLGIGATTAIFSVVDAVVLRGLPFDEHDRLVAVGERRAGLAAAADRDAEAIQVAAPQNYLDWAGQQRVFSSMAAIASGWLTLHEPGAEPESLVPQRVTSGFFEVLRTQPSLGRAFTVENEVDGRHLVAVLSDGLWRRRFASDPNIVGRVVPLQDLEGTAAGGYEIVGVMPPGFAYPVGAARATDIWIPYVVPPHQRQRDPSQRANYLQVIARLDRGVTRVQAQAQMDQIAAALERTHPTWNKDNGIGVRPLADHLVGARIRSWMLLLLGAVAIVLVIACANVANLLLARAAEREREVAIRAALGASRTRLVRELMTESLVLAVAGTVGAVIVAWWAVQVLRSAMPDNVPRIASMGLDLRVLVAAAGVMLLTALAVGLMPALQLARPDVVNALKLGGRGHAGFGRRRIRSALVVTEVALAVILLVGAGLFIGSFVSLVRIDPGFRADNVLTAQVSPRVGAGRDIPDFALTFADLVERVGRIPGVEHASMVIGGIPLSGLQSATSISLPGEPIAADDRGMIAIRYVTPEYHQALRVPLRRGRLFAATDTKSAPLVAIINESAARLYFPGVDPIGRVLDIGDDRTVVGVVADIRQASLETAARTEVFVPMAQGRAPGAELVVRTSGNPLDVLPAVKAAVYAVLPDVPLRNIRTLEALVASRTAQRRISMLLLSLFGVLGLTISAVGIYGLMAYLVSQRTREIGVRMALGATPRHVVAMVLRHAAAVVVAGLIAGTVASWYVSAASKAFLFNLEPTDWRAFAAAVTALVLAALAATAIPARRAARVDPMTALRAE